MTPFHLFDNVITTIEMSKIVTIDLAIVTLAIVLFNLQSFAFIKKFIFHIMIK